MDSCEEQLVKELEQKKLEDEQKKAEEGSGDSSRRRRRRHHHHSRKRRKRSRRSKKKRVKRIVITVISVVLSLVLVIAALAFSMYIRGKDSMNQSNTEIKIPESIDAEQSGDYIIYKGERYRLKSNLTSILFLGVDKRKSSEADKQIGENHQSDVIALGVIDSAGGTIKIINVPRDIMTDVNVYSPSGGYVGRERMQIALAYAYGDGKKTSCINAQEAVSRLFYNIPINTYFSMNLDGIQEINDSVGGVDVVSPETIGNFVKGEKYHLEGFDARQFVYLRDKTSPDANLKRNERQKIYLNAFIKKFIAATKKEPSTAISLFNASAPYSCTNLNADKITYLATEFIVNRNMKYDITNVPVDVKQVENHAENYVKEQEFFEEFLSIFYNKVK